MARTLRKLSASEQDDLNIGHQLWVDRLTQEHYTFKPILQDVA